MHSIKDYRKGNILEYYGPWGHGYAKVEDFDTGLKNLKLTMITDLNSDHNIIVATEGTISPIMLNQFHLNQLGFEYEPKTVAFVKDGLRLRKYIFAEGLDWWNMTAILTDYRIVPDGFPPMPSPDQINQHTVGLSFVHELQNYCSDQGIAFDFLSIYY